MDINKTAINLLENWLNGNAKEQKETWSILMKRKIKSHKGGRTARLDIRLTPDEKKTIEDKAIKLKLSKTDLIINAVRDYQAPKNG